MSIGGIPFKLGSIYAPRGRSRAKPRVLLDVLNSACYEDIVRYRVAGSTYERECYAKDWTKWVGHEVEGDPAALKAIAGAG